MITAEQIIERFGKLVAMQASDKEEYQEQIMQLANDHEGLVDNLIDKWVWVEEQINFRKSQIAYENRVIEQHEIELNKIKNTIIELSKVTGEEHSKSLRLQGSFAKIDVRKSISVKSNLRIEDVPIHFRQFTIKDKLSYMDKERILAVIKDLRIDSSIDKVGLKKYASMVHEEDKFLEESEYVVRL